MIARAENAKSLRDELFRNLGPAGHFNRLFDRLPGVLYFLKNREGILLGANDAFRRLFGSDTEEEFIGLSDYDILPRRLAEKYRQDDLRIMERREPQYGIRELFPGVNGTPGWFLTDKIPLLSGSGEVLGIIGTVRPCEERKPARRSVPGIAKALSHIHEHFRRNPAIPELAGMDGHTVRQFERLFRRHLNASPREYILGLRILAACESLRERKLSLADIAVDLGFYDQSQFTNQFRKQMGMTPLQYRKQY